MGSYIRSIKRLENLEQSPVEMTYYHHLQGLIQRELDREDSGVEGWHIQSSMGSEGTFPDFSIFNEEGKVIARIEAKKPEVTLANIVNNHPKQLEKYLNEEKSGHPNLFITNFLAFQRVSVEGTEVALVGENSTLFESSAQLIEFDLGNGEELEQKIEVFRNWIRELVELEPYEINTAERLRNSLGQVMWASGAWVNWAVSDEGQNTLNHADVELAKGIQYLATNIVIGKGDNTSSQSALIGQLLTVGLIMNERRVRVLEDQMDDVELGNDTTRMNRRKIETDLIPSSRLSRIVRHMYNYSDTMGTKQIIENAQRALMIRNPDLSEFRNLEIFLMRFMRQEFDKWVTQFGMVPTPPEVIDFMVSKSHRDLMNNHTEHPEGDDDTIGEMGLLDRKCQVLDPATGGGHYYIAVLRKIYDLSMEQDNSEQLARQEVKDAIGHGSMPGRIHAVDIQPMCISLTYVHLGEFCEEIGLELDDLEPRIYLGDTLRPRVTTLAEERDTPYQETMFGKKHLVIGNPPWGSFKTAEGVALNQDPIKRYLKPFRDPYEPLMIELTGNKPKKANQEIAYAFFSRFARGQSRDDNPPRGYTAPITCFIMPMTMIWSASWVGMRQWMLENGHARIENIGGSKGQVNRNDGENVFRKPKPVGQGNSIVTFISSNENRGVLALDLWETETTVEGVDAVNEGDLIEIEGIEVVAGPEHVAEAQPEQIIQTTSWRDKLSKLEAWSQDLPDEGLYDQTYSELQPVFGPFRPNPGIIEGAPFLANLFRPGQNKSGMEAVPGKAWRLIDANQEVLTNTIAEVFNYASYNDAVEAGGVMKHIVNGLSTNDADCEDKFNLIKEENQQNEFAVVSSSSMKNVHAFVPRILEDGKDTLKCWKALRLDKIALNQEFSGFFCFPDRIDNARNLEDGIVSLHLEHYPGYKHAAGEKNGRAVPHVICENVEQDEWIPNISDPAMNWLSENYEGFDITQLENGQKVWDYILAISASTSVQRGMEAYTGYELNIPFPNDFNLFVQVSELGKTMRLLQKPEYLAAENDYFALQGAVRNLLNIKLVDNNGEVEIENFQITDMKHKKDLTPENIEFTTLEIDWEQELDEEINLLCEISELERDDVLKVLGNHGRFSIDKSNDANPQAIEGVFQNIVEFRLGNRKVLQSWIAMHSDVSGDNNYPFATWTNGIRTTWYRELLMVIRNVATLMFLRPKIEDLASRVIDDILIWNNGND